VPNAFMTATLPNPHALFKHAAKKHSPESKFHPLPQPRGRACSTRRSHRGFARCNPSNARLLFVMGPHPDDLHGLDVVENLIDKPVLDIDAARTGASKVAH
jgi:hypothetical protein